MPNGSSQGTLRRGFAFLQPANPEARCAFNDLAVQIKDKSLKNPVLSHATKFICFEPYELDTSEIESGRQRNEAVNQGADIGVESSTESGTETDNSMSAASQLKYQGYYYLDFKPSTIDANNGWVIGLGRKAIDKETFSKVPQVDILLAPLGTPSKKYSVAGKHARLFFDTDGTMTLATVSVRNMETALGNDGFKVGRRIVLEPRSRISFGSLTYYFGFHDDLDETEYQKNLRTHFRNILFLEEPAPDFSAIPSPNDVITQQWLVRATIGKGSHGTVSAAKHKSTGMRAAAKILHRCSTKSYACIAQEINILAHLPNCPQLLQLVEASYERENRSHTAFPDEDDERYRLKIRPERVTIIFKPFTQFTFEEMLFLIQPQRLLLSAFYQVLQGIQALHRGGFIHRDIKPGNLGVVSLKIREIDIVILDYGQTTSSQTCAPAPGRFGTPSYRAPEMDREAYTNKVDIWACGVVGLQIFVTPGQLQWLNVVTEKILYDDFCAASSGASPSSIQHLLIQMLAWDAADRISAADALNHPCFAEIRDAEKEEDDSSAEIRDLGEEEDDNSAETWDLEEEDLDEEYLKEEEDDSSAEKE